jgi:hypothetical protein
MDMHHAAAGVEGGFGLARHLLRDGGDMMLLRVGQNTVQRGVDDSLVAHDWPAIRSGLHYAIDTADYAPRARLASCVHSLSLVLASARPALAVDTVRGGIVAVNREISRAQKDRTRLQPIEPAEGMAEVCRVGIADILRQLRKVEILIGEMQQMPRALQARKARNEMPVSSLNRCRKRDEESLASAAQLAAVTGSRQK